MPILILKIYLHTIVGLELAIGPAAPVCANHITTVADGAKVKAVILSDNDILVANTDSNPIRGALFDLVRKGLDLRPFLNFWLHDGKLIPCRVLTFDYVLRDQIDVIVFESC